MKNFLESNFQQLNYLTYCVNEILYYPNILDGEVEKIWGFSAGGRKYVSIFGALFLFY